MSDIGKSIDYALANKPKKCVVGVADKCSKEMLEEVCSKCLFEFPYVVDKMLGTTFCKTFGMSYYGIGQDFKGTKKQI